MSLPKHIVLATRKSQLALVQTELTLEYLKKHLPGHTFEILPMSTTGDRQLQWSLQKKGGKGLFTKELEDALLNKQAHIAVHSAKDLPTENPENLNIAGYLPREIPTDTLVLKNGTVSPKIIASGSPRRQAQGVHLFDSPVQFIEIRGNVQTRLNKIVEGSHGDGTFVASAALKRLNIDTFPELTFQPLTLQQMVPAVGQGAIALQCHEQHTSALAEMLCQTTYYAATVERTFLSSFGGGCHVAHAAHFENNTLHVFHPNCGIKQFPFNNIPLDAIPQTINSIIQEIKA